jgi:hypothetical protein
MASSLSDIEKKIKNIDEHIVLSLNILKYAQNKGTAGTVKLANGFMEYETAAKILDMKPSSGESIKISAEICRANPDDAVSKTAISLIDKIVDGPWSDWIVLRSK